jgi:putative hemolysin
MTLILIEALIILALILVNSLFALSEIAVVSSRKVRLLSMAEDGQPGAEIALELAESPNRFLSTVQIGITLVGILAGAFGGSTIARELGELLAPLPLIGPYSQAVGLGVVVATITFLTVVLGELVPKRIALQNSERIAAMVARPMRALSVVATPVVRLLAATTDLIVRLLGINAPPQDVVTEEEIRILVQEGVQAGIIAQEELDMLDGVFRLDDRPLSAVMTPRTEIVWWDTSVDVETQWQSIIQTNHSRFPVCEGDLDNVLGIVRAKDLLASCLQGQGLDVVGLAQEVLILPETMLVGQSLEQFRTSGQQVALLIDEYGGVEGLVTLFDILETIVGDIPTLDELVEPQVVTREDGSWLVDGLIRIDDFKAFFGLDEMPGDDNFYTLGGFVIVHTGRVPRTGDTFEWDEYRFEVVDMDRHRVDKVLVERKAGERPAGNDLT